MTTIHQRIYCSKNSVPVSQAFPLANLFSEPQRNRFRSCRLFSQRDSPNRASFCLTIVSQAQPFPARAIQVLSQGWSVLLLTTNLFINSVSAVSPCTDIVVWIPSIFTACLNPLFWYGNIWLALCNCIHFQFKCLKLHVLSSLLHV